MLIYSSDTSVLYLETNSLLYSGRSWGDAKQRLQSVNTESGGLENFLPGAFREQAEKASEDLKWILIKLGILLNF